MDDGKMQRAGSAGLLSGGLAAAIWIVAGQPSGTVAALLLLASVGASTAAWLFSGKTGAGPGRGLAAGMSVLLVSAAAFHVVNVESGLLAGLLHLRTGVLGRVAGSWDASVLSVGSGLGLLLGIVITCETAGAALKNRKDRKGRKRAESELYGKARFLDRRYMRSLARRRGIMLGSSPDGLIAYALEGSAMTFAPPRTGKGATIALNYLAPGRRQWPGSTVLIDPRGETFPVAARRRRCLGRRPVLLDPFGVVASHRRIEAGGGAEGPYLPVWRSDRYNPLDFIREGREAVRDIGVLVDALLETPKGDGGTMQHFHESSRALISGYLAWVRFREPPERRNLSTLHRMLSASREEREAFFARVDETPRFAGGLMHVAMERLRQVGAEEGGSNFTTIANQLSFLNYPEIAEHTERSTFDPLDLAAGDMDLFVVVPDDMLDMVRGWLRLWITIPYAVSGRRVLDRDMLVIVDEMPRIGYLKPIMDGYNMAAGRGVHFWCFAQSWSALTATWGDEACRTLLDLAELVQVLGFPRLDVEGAERLSKAIGATTFESMSESRSGQMRDASLLQDGQTSLQESVSVVKEQLVTADDLMTMGPDDQVVIAAPKDMPRDAFRLRHARYWQLPELGRWVDPNPYVIRKERAGLSSAA